VINAINLPGKDNPRWGRSNAIETMRTPGGHLRPPLGACATGVGWFASGSATAAGAIGTGYGRVVAWLAGLPRRAGRRLFAVNDAEARWHRWQVTELRGGLARSYHDPRFDLLRVVQAHDPPEPEPEPEAQGARDATDATDPPATVHRRPGDWDDVHGWPWDGEV
jgi:hypothetical protein